MRKVLITLLALTSLALMAPVGVGAGEPTGIRGVVLDATCYGPCRYPPRPLSPYAGQGLTVTVRNLPDNLPVARLRPTGGRFAIKLPPGWYRLTARVTQKPPCWRGETRKAQVIPGELARVRLRVANECVR